MKKMIILATLLVFWGQQLFSQTLVGVYSSDFNELTIYLDGNSVTGTYKHLNGRIEATLEGRTITGWWYQSNGKGRFIFEFSSDFSTFKGKWGYNDAAPTSQWNGNRISGNYIPQQRITISSQGTAEGVYSSDFNELTIIQNGDMVTGTYKHRNGRIEGRLNGRALIGTWVQDNGKGRFIFEFNSDFSGFTGKWGYNDADPSSQWNGKRIGGATTGATPVVSPESGKMDGIFSSDFNELTITQNGNKITGTYKHRNGRIEGTASGRTISGTWAQDNGKGTFIFEFNPDYSGFTGKWGYNDAVPSSQWNGKRIGGGGTPPLSQSSPNSSPSSAPKPAQQSTPTPQPTSTPLKIEVSSNATVAGSLPKDGVELNIPDGTFAQKTGLQIKETNNVPAFDKQRASQLGNSVEITIDQTIKRLYQPVSIQLQLTPPEKAALQHRGDLWIGYFNGKSWDYFRPVEVNTSSSYVKFDTYHFSIFSKAVLTKEERQNNFALKNAVTQMVEKDNNAHTRQATEQMVQEILAKKMGLNNKSLAQDVVEAILKENDYTSLLVSYNDGRMDDFSQDLAVLAGKKICSIVTTDSNSKALLDSVTQHSSKIGAGIKIAYALSNGDGEEAAKELSREILNTYPLTKMLATAAELTERQINRWKDQELEAAYQVYVNGAESSVPWWGYQVESGNFDQVWEQMRGLEAKITDDAIKDYAALKKMHPNSLNTAIKDKIRREAKENLRKEFTKRKGQEATIESIKADNLKLINEFENANLLTRYRFGYGEKLSMDDRLEQLFKIKAMILKDTQSKLGFSGINQGGVISSKAVTNLIQIWYGSDNGPEKYRQELIRLGYKKEEQLASKPKEAAKPAEEKYVAPSQTVTEDDGFKETKYYFKLVKTETIKKINSPGMVASITADDGNMSASITPPKPKEPYTCSSSWNSAPSEIRLGDVIVITAKGSGNASIRIDASNVYGSFGQFERSSTNGNQTATFRWEIDRMHLPAMAPLSIRVLTMTPGTSAWSSTNYTYEHVIID